MASVHKYVFSVCMLGSRQEICLFNQLLCKCKEAVVHKQNPANKNHCLSNIFNKQDSKSTYTSHTGRQLWQARQIRRVTTETNISKAQGTLYFDFNFKKISPMKYNLLWRLCRFYECCYLTVEQTTRSSKLCFMQESREVSTLLSGYFPRRATSDFTRLQTCFSALILADSSCASTISRSAVIWTLSLSASSNSSIRSSFLRRLSWKMMGD